MTLVILIVVLLLLFGGGLGYSNYSRGPSPYAGNGFAGGNLIWVILVVLVVLALFGHFGGRWY